MARRRKDDEGGYPLFWLLLGFLCGVVATLGVLLLMTGPGRAPPPAALPTVSPANPPAPPPKVEPAAPPMAAASPAPKPEHKAAPPRPPSPVRPAPHAAPDAPRSVAAPPHRPPHDTQIADDAAAAGMTARTR